MITAIIDYGIDQSAVEFFDTSSMECLQIRNQTIEKAEFRKLPTHGGYCAKVFSFYADMPPNYCICLPPDSNNLCNADDLCLALRWCVDNGITLVSLSMGTNMHKDSDAIYCAVKEATDNGILIIAASSNNGLLTYPASFEECIGVCYDQSNSIPVDSYAFRERAFNNIDVVTSQITLESDSIPACNSLATAFIAGLMSVNKVTVNNRHEWLKNHGVPFLCGSEYSYYDAFIHTKSSHDTIRIAFARLAPDVFVEYADALHTMFTEEGYICFSLSNTGWKNIKNRRLEYTKNEYSMFAVELAERISAADILMFSAELELLSPDNTDLLVTVSTDYDLQTRKNIPVYLLDKECSPHELYCVILEMFK